MLRAFAERRNNRRGFTLVELLVVVAIIAILIALLLPAIQKVRDSSNTLQCKNKLKQMGIALHSYVSEHKVFPPALVVTPSQTSYPCPPPPDQKIFFGWMSRILPYMEQKPLYEQVNWAAWPWQHPIYETTLPIYWCDSDPRTSMVINYGGDLVALTEYMGVSGTDQFAQDGILYVNSRVSPRMISDGTSNTLLVGERPPSVDDVYGWWFAGSGQAPMNFGATDVVLGTNEVTGSSPAGARDFFRPGSINDPANAHRFHYWSQHDGGSNFLFADGSVHFVTYDIGQTIFNALGTRAGGESITMNFN